MSSTKRLALALAASCLAVQLVLVREDPREGLEPPRRPEEVGSEASPDAWTRRAADPVDTPAERGHVERVAHVIEVVDADGDPVPHTELETGVRAPSYRAHSRVRADAAGVARLEPAPSNPAGETVIRALLPIHPAPELVLPREAGQAPVRLRLPPTGTVVLEVLDADGARLEEPVELVLFARAADGTNVDPAPLELSAADGRARVEHVGLGLDLFLVARPGAGHRRAGSASAAGPVMMGQEVVLRASLGAAWPELALRALDADGAPLASTELEAVVAWPRVDGVPFADERALVLDARTGADGRARFRAPGLAGRSPGRTLTLRRPAGTHDGDVTTALTAEVDLSWDPGDAPVVELGDVVLTETDARDGAAPWVRGTVVDAEGAPVARASVLVSPLDEDGIQSAAETRLLEADADGAFRVVGPADAERLAVRALAREHLRASQVVERGAEDVRLVLSPAVRWQGRALLDPGFSVEELTLDVVQGGDRHRARADGADLVVEGLAYRPLDLEVRTRVGDWPLERRGASITGDVLDLRGRLVRLTLRLADSEGAPLERTFARITPDGLEPGGAWIRGGRLELVVPAEVTRLSVRPGGFQPFEVLVVDGEQRLTCER